MPVNNRAFWMKKLTGNQARDRLVTRMLRKTGWRVVRVWEHDLKKPVRVLARICKALAVA
jgi:DNA mismatch endonuclease (patch repair protein)